MYCSKKELCSSGQAASIEDRQGSVKYKVL